MKFLVLALVMVFAISVAYAAPVGNIATPAMLKSAFMDKDNDNDNVQMGIIVGPEFDFVNDRKIKDQAGDTKLDFYGGRAGVVFADKVFVYGIAGAGTAEEEATVLGSKVKWESETNFVWGLGATVILYETKLQEFGDGILRLGVDARYRSVDFDVDEVVVDGVSYDITSGSLSNVELDISEWQIAPAISYQLGKFVPYLGVRFSDIDVEAKATLSGTKYEIDYESYNGINKNIKKSA